MTNFKNTVAAITLMVVIAFTTTVANAGIITAGFADTNPPTCTQEPTKGKDSGVLTGLTGIITAGLTGIITAGFTGIITAGFSSDAPVNCGIITAG